MEEKVVKKVSGKKKSAASKAVSAKPGLAAAGVSPVKKGGAKAETKTKKTTKKPSSSRQASLDVTSKIAAVKPEVELSPTFKVLAEPALPQLKRENRARLMLQTPTELYFYWTVRENPYQLLRTAFGENTGSYTLVLKLNDLTTGAEEIYPAEAEGNWWFNVEPNRKYEAEIGFYAPNRPYFRIVYSNTIETPRRAPSPRPASDADWHVSANQFAEVLDVAGYSQDAFDVALAGDDHEVATAVTHVAFSQFVGDEGHPLDGLASEDIRYVLTALAAGIKLEEIRSRISRRLYSILQANSEKLSAEKAMSTLQEFFGVDEEEFTEDQVVSAVYGASVVNFPRTLKTGRTMPKFAPFSSHSYR